MGESTVQEILERIDQLSHEERELLEERLAEREAAAWEQTVSEARRTARTLVVQGSPATDPLY